MNGYLLYAWSPHCRRFFTVKASNFVILLGENIFFRRTFLRKPHDFFWYWNLCGRGLGVVQSHFGLGHCLGLENSFFCRVTKLGDIKSPNFVTLWSFQSYNEDCKQRMLMWSLFLWWKNSQNPYESHATLHGFIGWVQGHIEEKLYKICKFKNIFFHR